MKPGKSILLPFVIGLLSLASCAPKVVTRISKSYPAVAFDQEVRVFDVDENAPIDAEFLGQVIIKDNGLSVNCGYETVMQLASTEVRKMGGNALKIIDHRWPSTFGSSCHQINASALLISDQAMLEEEPSPKNIYVREPSQANKTIDSGRKLRFALDGGLSWRFGEIPEGVSVPVRNYLRELKSGHSFSAELTYQLNENLGLGAMYSQYLSKHSVSNITLDFSDGTSYTGPTSDNIKIQFVGPVLFNRQVSHNQKGAFTSNFSLGYLSYKNVSSLGPDFLQISGGTIGMGFGVGYEFYLSKSVGLGLTISGSLGTLTKVKVSNGFSSATIKLSEEEYESLGRFDVSLGLRLYN